MMNDTQIQGDNPTQEECQDQLIECHSECDINDTECKTDCVEEFKDCEISCYEDDTEIDCKELQEDYHVDEGEIISEILTLTALLNGKCERTQTLDSRGRSSKRIIIEYDIQYRDETTSQETTTDQT